MLDKRENNLYDDENIPRIDLPQETDMDSDFDYGSDKASASYRECQDAEPLPESTRPRKDGPGGE